MSDSSRSKNTPQQEQPRTKNDNQSRKGRAQKASSDSNPASNNTVSSNRVSSNTASQQHAQRQEAAGRRISHMPITAFAALIVVILASIQLLSVFHTYALNLAQLNALRNQEAALIEQKEQLEHNIERWDDKAYITAQARERLGFVFPSEKSVRVLGAENIEEDTQQQNNAKQSGQQSVQDPWYHTMMLSIHEADDSGTVK